MSCAHERLLRSTLTPHVGENRVRTSTQVTDVTEVLQSMSLLSQREGTRITWTQHLNLSSMKLDGLPSCGALHQHALDTQADANISSLQNLLIVGNFLAIHYKCQEASAPTHTLQVVEGRSIINHNKSELATTLQIILRYSVKPAYGWYGSSRL